MNKKMKIFLFCVAAAMTAFLFATKFSQVEAADCNYEAGDANHDGVINFLDYIPFKTEYNSATHGDLCGIDMNNNGSLNSTDFNLFKNKLIDLTGCNYQPGDANHDNLINNLDLNLFGTAYTQRGTDNLCVADMNCDGMINSTDFNIFKNKLVETSSCGYEAGDANHDNAVNYLDFEPFKTEYASGTHEIICGFDMNNDNILNSTDFNLFKNKLIQETGCSYLPGDANQDGLINYSDFDQFKTAYIQKGTDNLCIADLNCNGMINSTDFNLFKNILAENSSCVFEAGDANYDNVVNYLDFEPFRVEYTSATHGDLCGVDMNNDRVLNSTDFNLFKNKLAQVTGCAYQPGDANHDNLINNADLDLFRTAYTQGGSSNFCTADMNCNGMINSTDFNLFKNILAETASSSTNTNNTNQNLITTPQNNVINNLLASSSNVKTLPATSSPDVCSGDCREKKSTSTPHVISLDNKISSPIEIINQKANFLFNGQINELLAEIKTTRNTANEQNIKIKYFKKLTLNLEKLSDKMEQALNNFVAYGVDANTMKLGAGERAAVIYSYNAAYNKLPETEKELIDAILIANGRYPGIISISAEKKAKQKFIEIFKRIPDMNNEKDTGAIKIMAYGLRQTASNRNLNSEKQSINTFRHIFNKQPDNTESWNSLQAIAYSGATKQTDTDGDLLSDSMEKTYGTDPRIADSDNDGHKDGEEVLNGYNPKGIEKLK